MYQHLEYAKDDTTKTASLYLQNYDSHKAKIHNIKMNNVYQRKNC